LRSLVFGELPLHFGRTARSRKDAPPIQFDSPSSFGRTKIAKRRERRHLIRRPGWALPQANIS